MLLGQISFCPASSQAPLSLTADHCPQPLLFLSCRITLQGRQAHLDSQHISGSVLWQRSFHQRSGSLLRCPLSKHHQLSPQPHPASTARLGHFCVPQSSLFPSQGTPDPVFSVTWSEWGQNLYLSSYETHGKAVTGNPVATKVDLLPCLGS